MAYIHDDDMPFLALPPDDDIYEESGALPSWTQFFDLGGAYLDVRDTTPTVCFVPELDNKWGFKVMKAYDEHKAYNAMGDDHYIALRLNDWVCPRADFWSKCPCWDRWQIDGDEEWTFVSTYSLETLLVEHGWVPTEWMNYSLDNQVAGTYVSLQLGCTRFPLPAEKLPCHVDEHPRCHCTIGYLPRLSHAATKGAKTEGNRLIRKYINDGHLPDYTHRPHVCCTYDGREHIAGICKYSSRHIAGPGNSYLLMRYGKVAVPDPIIEFVADFDHVHVRRGTGPPNIKGLSIVGSLDASCNIHELAVKLRGFLENEVLGQWNEPNFNFGFHHWSKPHVTLSKIWHSNDSRFE